MRLLTQSYLWGLYSKTYVIGDLITIPNDIKVTVDLGKETCAAIVKASGNEEFPAPPGTPMFLKKEACVGRTDGPPASGAVVMEKVS